MDDPRIAFELFGRPVQWYGVMFALGFLAAVLHWAWLGRRTERKPGLGSDLGLWIIIGGVIGARAAFVLSDLGYFASNPAEIIRIDEGGLVFYGGFVGGVIAYFITYYFHRKAESTYVLHDTERRDTAWSLGDFTITALPLGHALGRMGCWLNGCCYGSVTDSPLGVLTKFRDATGQVTQEFIRYPVQLFEVAGLLVLYPLTLLFYFKNRVPGRVFTAYMMAYACLRFTNEFFRGDQRLESFTGFDYAQNTAIVMFLIGIPLFWWLGKRHKKIENTLKSEAA